MGGRQSAGGMRRGLTRLPAQLSRALAIHRAVPRAHRLERGGGALPRRRSALTNERASAATRPGALECSEYYRDWPRRLGIHHTRRSVLLSLRVFVVCV